MKYKKVRSVQEALELLKQGRKLRKDQGKWYLQDLTHTDEDWTAYIPAAVRKELEQRNPELFSDPSKAEISDVLLKGHVPGEHDEQAEKLQGLTAPELETKPEKEQQIALGVQIPAAPTPDNPRTEEGTNIAPQEFILHDTARRALESVWVLEGFHKIKEADRHELAFAHVGLDAKGNPQTRDKYDDKKKIVFSLADLSVYFLIDCYMKFQKADETIISLNVEKTLLYNAYMQEKEKRKELEDALMLKMILKI